MTKNNPHIGRTLDQFLEEEGITEEINALAQKKIVALQLREAMRANDNLSEKALARRMATSRTVVRSLLDQTNDSATLKTIVKAAHAVGYEVQIKMFPKVSAKRRTPGVGKASSSRSKTTVRD